MVPQSDKATPASFRNLSKRGTCNQAAGVANKPEAVVVGGQRTRIKLCSDPSGILIS